MCFHIIWVFTAVWYSRCCPPGSQVCIWAAPRLDCPQDAPTPGSPRTLPPWPAAVPEAEQAGCPWCKTPPPGWSHCTKQTQIYTLFTFFCVLFQKLRQIIDLPGHYFWGRRESSARGKGGCASWLTNSAETERGELSFLFFFKKGKERKMRIIKGHVSAHFKGVQGLQVRLGLWRASNGVSEKKKSCDRGKIEYIYVSKGRQKRLEVKDLGLI